MCWRGPFLAVRSLTLVTSLLGAVIQLATAMSEDVHDPNPVIIIKALAGSYLLIVVL